MAIDSKREPASEPETTGRRWIVKVIMLGALFAVIGYVLFQYRDALTLANIARHESEFRQFQADHPAGVFAVVFLIYVLVTGLSIPLATVLTLAYGWFFGFWRALIVVSFASTAGSTVAFLLSRYLLRDLIRRRFGDRLKKFDDALERDGAFYLFTLRLTPVVPFFVVNLVMGLTPMRARTFWWVSQLGMLAGTCVYVNAGASIPTAADLADYGVSGLLTWQLFIAFLLLGLFPLAAKRVMARFASVKDAAN